MKIRTASVVESELVAAFRYYEEQVPGLGTEFLYEYDAAINRCALHPSAWSKIGPNTRRILLRRFPYGILYVLHEDEIIVTALMALKSDPERWCDRIN